ncbi:MAG: HAMP domain-containing protein [Bdellovibrionaceae bacterium]|nr:HAMP domain-containing protein [Bdellovibrionales bacterium]MCB9084176.1 HAMP domain-containing protein [Pseudobdellovibrionaceae bacterium]
MRPLFSIRYKFLIVTTLLLVLCVGAYLGLAAKILKGDKTELVYDYNRSAVTNIASDIETFFQGVADKIKLVAFFFNENKGRSNRLMRELLESDSETVFVGGSDGFSRVEKALYTSGTYLETYGIKEEYFLNQLPAKRPIPFDRIRVEGEAVWNATILDGPPLVGFGRSVVEETEAGVPVRQYAVISYLRADKLMTALGRATLNEVFITNEKGEILAHPKVEMMGQEGSPDALILKAMEHPLNTSVLPAEVDGKKVLGAFSKAFNKRIMVVSRVSEDKAFAVVYHLIYRSLFFALIVLTASFIAAILFSRSLTRPLETLMGGMRNVSEGDLETQIAVKTKDEISVLAKSFNHMIRDLKQSREELEHINAELENKVKERTHQLEVQNQAVKKAQEALLRTTRLAAVGEIAGRAAHEVLNPLTGIMSRIQKIQSRLRQHQGEEAEVLKEILAGWEKDFADKGLDGLVSAWNAPSEVFEGASLFQEDLENIKAVSGSLTSEVGTLTGDVDFLLKECQRINRIVQSMRSLSVVKGESKPHDVGHLVRESMHVMADLASQMKAEISMDEMDKDITVMVDQDEFLQAMTNLLRNALQAVKSRADVEELQGKTFKGKVEISVQADEGKALIGVMDNGVGIEEEHKRRLFESQFSTKPREEGTGLGLNISRRFIRAFGGDIRLGSSTLGKGTIFVVELPIAVATDDEKVSA